MAVVATIRPACDGIFGPCVAVEEGTTNLMAVSGVDPDFEVDSNNDGLADGWQVWVAASGDPTRAHSFSLVDGVNGGMAQYIEITASGNANNSSFDSVTTFTVSPSTTYTLSVYVAANKVATVYFVEYDSTSTWLKSTPLAVTADSSWHRCELTVTTTATTAKMRCFIYFGSDVGNWIKVDKIQLEQKSFATSFVDGTRNYGSLYYKVGPCPDEGTVAFWWRPNYVPVANDTRTLIAWGGYQTSNNYTGIVIRINAVPDLVWAGGNDLANIWWSGGAGHPFTAVDWYFVTATWKPGSQICRVYDSAGNNVKTFVNTGNYTSLNGGEYLSLSGEPAATPSTYVPEALYSNVLLLRQYVDTATMDEWAQLKKPFYEPSPQIIVPRPTNVGLTVA